MELHPQVLTGKIVFLLILETSYFSVSIQGNQYDSYSPFLFFREKQNQILPGLIQERHCLLEIEPAFENELKVISLPIFVGVHPAWVARKFLQGMNVRASR